MHAEINVPPGDGAILGPKASGGSDGPPDDHTRTALRPQDRRRERRKPRSLTWAFMLQLVAGVGFAPMTFGL